METFKRTYATGCVPRELHPEPLPLWQSTADLYLCRRLKHRSDQWGPWVLVNTRLCLSPPSVSGGYEVSF